MFRFITLIILFLCFIPELWARNIITMTATTPTCIGLSCYPYKKKISFPTDTVTISSGINDFPLCVHINASSWPTAGERTHFANGNTDGKRVNFYDKDGIKLAYEIDYYNGSTEAIYWVKLVAKSGHEGVESSDNGTENYIYIGYGSDPFAENQDNASGVWNSNFVAVWHMGDNKWVAGDTTSEMKDSTSNGITGDAVSVTANQTGNVINGASFDGSSSYIKTNTTLTNGFTGITMSIWAKQDTQTSYQMHFSKDLVTANRQIHAAYFRDGSTNKLQMYLWDSAATLKGPVSYTWSDMNTTDFFFITYAWSSGNTMKIYVNGAEAATYTAWAGSLASTTSEFRIGNRNLTGSYLYFDGILDEARISNIERSADWIKLQYYSMKKTNWNGDAWLTIGAEE